MVLMVRLHGVMLELFGIEFVNTSCRCRDISDLKLIFAHIMMSLTGGAAKMAVARFVGWKSHASVWHAKRTADDLMETDKCFCRLRNAAATAFEAVMKYTKAACWQEAYEAVMKRTERLKHYT